MFDRDIKLNQFFLAYFEEVIADIPANRITERAPGNGHPPVWVLGHLAIVGEMGQVPLGGQLQHPEWAPLFSPGSSDEVPGADQFAKDDLVQVIHTAYPKLGELLKNAPSEVLDQPHTVELLKGSSIETVADLEVHVLTTHFAFHLAQLSGWRRAAGLGPLV